MAGRLEPGWRFSSLYLIKDSLAVMLRSAGLLQDALREFYELEAVYLNAIASGGAAVGGHDFGAVLTLHSLLAAASSAADCRKADAAQQTASPSAPVRTPVSLSLPANRLRLPAA
jgi:hypothetical protein